MPGFTERTFEFCYNAEFCRRYGALLAAAPNIPSLRAEKELGYDVEFILREGKRTRSLFLQHKVSCFAEHRRWNNASMFDSHGGPYFRFPLDTEQQNTLIDRFDPNVGVSFYCAPLFHRAAELDRHFLGESVVANSVWVLPQKIGRIVDAEQHNVTFDPAAGSAYVHSEPRQAALLKPADGIIPIELPRVESPMASALSLSNQLQEVLFESAAPPSLHAEFARATSVQRLQYILGRFLGISWLLFDDDHAGPLRPSDPTAA